MPGGSRPGGMRRCDARGTRPKDALSWFVIEVVTSAASRMRVSCNKHPGSAATDLSGFAVYNWSLDHLSRARF